MAASNAAINQSVAQFKEFTGSADDKTARRLLEACDWNVDRAVELFFLSGGNEANMQNNQNDDDIQVIEEIEAANVDEDPSVRRPINPVRERLVDQSYSQYYGGNVQSRREANPIFEQFRDDAGPSTSRGQREAVRQAEARRRRDLSSIFRPPIDIMSRLDWDDLLEDGRKRKRFLLVNVQDASEFACQVLNRDVWSNPTLKEMIKAQFIFWQVYSDTPNGRRISGYYSLHSYPAIFIVDPRTGENTHTIKVRDITDIMAELSDFADKYSSFERRDIAVRSVAFPHVPDDTYAMEEAGPSHSNGNVKPKQIKRKLPDKSTADYQAKRMKNVVITDDFICLSDDEDEKPSLGNWETLRAVPDEISKEISVVFRISDGSRHALSLNDNCNLKVLFAFLENNGVDISKASLVLLYPRREFSLVDAEKTLREAHFCVQEMVHVDIH